MSFFCLRATGNVRHAHRDSTCAASRPTNSRRTKKQPADDKKTGDLEDQRAALVTAGAGTLARKRGIRAFLTLANEVPSSLLVFYLGPSQPLPTSLTGPRSPYLPRVTRTTSLTARQTAPRSSPLCACPRPPSTCPRTRVAKRPSGAGASPCPRPCLCWTRRWMTR